MKNLLRKLIKVLFGIIIPGIIIMYTACSFFTLPVKILLIIIFIILWFSIMKEVKLIPAMKIGYYKGICVGAFYDKGNFYIVLPFIYIVLN